ncbi:SDR family NAD(P)-dependent oxidoreductase [Leisingera daeponensis]|uniref:SDR family NAD(P)-dependent oxidoreductase n=1 Tax=Leisingera daeponensis TaxID=405746 RepID=UPI001C943853|nr:3-oxoacyl-ACP reductase family protein [Leisingera daeponensis]MBY6059404.1 3-oxoacyl-ACP reductase FabG [Leisingera daeponensis]
MKVKNMLDLTNTTSCRRLEGQVAIVTGGAGGIGKETARRLFAEGAQVAIFDAFSDAVESAIAELARDGIDAMGLTVDIADPDKVARAVKSVSDECGGIDILACCAGVRPLGTLFETSMEDWKLSLDVNLTGVFLCAREVGRHMAEQQSGSIIVIASVNALRGVATQVAYCASKAGAVGLTQVLATELGPFGVRVNAIAPAQVETPMIAEQVGEVRKKREERIPMRRYGKPEEIAGAVAFLASEDAGFVNGHVLCVDGGYTTYGIHP